MNLDLSSEFTSSDELVPSVKFTSFADELVLCSYLPQSSWIISNELKLISDFKGLTIMEPLIPFSIHPTLSL